jgi:very-short-patch-repair endonuclease/predicted transcriptional regulator of viral defense system
MAPVSQRSDADSLLWALARAQYWVLTHGQIREAGLSAEAIRHRVATGRLHRIHRGVYVVGRPQLTQLGYWMAAVLACGDGACLAGTSGAALWEIARQTGRIIEVTVRASSHRRHEGIRIRRRPSLPAEDVVTRHGIPVTSPVRTLLDLALALDRYGLEAAINEADKQDLIDPESLRVELADRAGQPGVRVLRRVLDRHTFRLTDTELERRFLRIVRRAGLPLPETQVWLGGRVDFVWQDLGLVVETDGLRYHRTAISQTSDLRRDQGHAVAGRERLRFSHAQVRYEPAYVTEILTRVIQRLCRALAEPAGLEAR